MLFFVFFAFSVCYSQKTQKEVGFTGGVTILSIYATSKDSPNLNARIIRPSLYSGLVYEKTLKTLFIWVSKVGFIDVNYYFKDPLNLLDQSLNSRKHYTIYSGFYYPLHIKKQLKGDIGMGFEYHTFRVRENNYFTDMKFTTPVNYSNYQATDAALVLSLGVKKSFSKLALSSYIGIVLFLVLLVAICLQAS